MIKCLVTSQYLSLHPVSCALGLLGVILAFIGLQLTKLLKLSACSFSPHLPTPTPVPSGTG